MNKYKYITCLKTNKNILLNSRKGKQLLKNYIKKMRGSSYMSLDHKIQVSLNYIPKTIQSLLIKKQICFNEFLDYDSILKELNELFKKNKIEFNNKDKVVTFKVEHCNTKPPINNIKSGGSDTAVTAFTESGLNKTIATFMLNSSDPIILNSFFKEYKGLSLFQIFILLLILGITITIVCIRRNKPIGILKRHCYNNNLNKKRTKVQKFAKMLFMKEKTIYNTLLQIIKKKQVKKLLMVWIYQNISIFCIIFQRQKECLILRMTILIIKNIVRMIIIPVNM